MKQLRLLMVIGMLLSVSTALADYPIYNAYWTTEELTNSFQVTVTFQNCDPDFSFMVYRDLLLPAGNTTRHYFTAEPVPAPSGGEDLVISYNNLDMDPSIEFTTIGRFVIEITLPDGSLWGTESVLLTWADTYRVAKGFLVEDDLLNPCLNVGLMECTTVELLYGELGPYVGSPELLEFYGYILSYDGMDDCALMIQEIVPLGVGTPCEDPVSNKEMSWDNLKAAYR